MHYWMYAQPELASQRSTPVIQYCTFIKLTDVQKTYNRHILVKGSWHKLNMIAIKFVKCKGHFDFAIKILQCALDRF